VGSPDPGVVLAPSRISEVPGCRSFGLKSFGLVLPDQAQPVAFGAGAEQAGNGAVECLDEGVEIGVHEASVVDVAAATPILGSLAAVAIARPPKTSESLI
jgi:hypothetical protein